jgi:hypothetical protein
MIVEVLGYKFQNKQIADNYVTLVDARYGLPNGGNTLHYFEPVEGNYDGVYFYWINSNDGLIPDLGQPYNFYLDNGL